MVRTGLLAFLAASLALTVAASQAQPAPPENEDGRYTFHRADDGYLRLDGRSGQVSTCNRRPAGWLCQAVPDDRTALEAEIARLAGENATLKKELLSRNLPLPSNVRPEPPPANTNGKRIRPPDDAGFNRVRNFVERIWRRLVGMIVSVQRDIMKKS